MVRNIDKWSIVSRIAHGHLRSKGINPGDSISEEFRPERTTPIGTQRKADWIVKFMCDPPDEVFVFHIVVVDPETMEASIVPQM